MQYQKSWFITQVTTFPTTPIKYILFPFDKVTGISYEPKSEDNVEMQALKYYNFDGKHNIFAHKGIIEIDKHQ